MEDHVHRITTVGARVLINETWYKSAEQQGLLMLHRARDLLMRQGFGLEVDGRMKAVFPTQEEAQKSAEILKARYPLLQVKVYDALSSGITCTKPAGSRPAGFALAYCCSLPWACIRRTAKASRSEIESFDRSRGRRNHLHKYIRICHRQRTALSATDKRRAICCGIELCTRGMSG